jgi:7-carboxy-7-deazaguanine synthase
MSADDICKELSLLGTKVPWIILTGGNPALHDLQELVDKLHEYGLLVAVETQGSRWREWMRDVDRLCVSPKPPSAKQEYDWVNVQRFLEEGMGARALENKDYEWLFLKIVIFDEEDLDWAANVRTQLSDALLYLSTGNDAGRTVGNPTRKDDRAKTEVQLDLIDKSLWLVEEVFKRPELCQADVIVQSQYHVLLWGNELGH